MGELIPTDAGKTLINDHHNLPIKAHPHARGENALAVFQWGWTFGSSPRPWGKLSHY